MAVVEEMTQNARVGDPLRHVEDADDTSDMVRSYLLRATKECAAIKSRHGRDPDRHCV